MHTTRRMLNWDAGRNFNFTPYSLEASDVNMLMGGKNSNIHRPLNHKLSTADDFVICFVYDFRLSYQQTQ